MVDQFDEIRRAHRASQISKWVAIAGTAALVILIVWMELHR